LDDGWKDALTLNWRTTKLGSLRSLKVIVYVLWSAGGFVGPISYLLPAPIPGVWKGKLNEAFAAVGKMG
jgi:hypothetical protein